MADGRLKRVKLKFERDFTQFPNAWFRDSNLTLAARGLLGLLMTHRDGYVVTYRSLAATNPEGLSAVQTIVQNLKENGYLVIHRERGNNGRIIGYVWELTDPEEEKSRSTPYMDFPDMGKPDMGKPDMDNRHLKEALEVQEDLTTNALGTISRQRAKASGDAFGDDLRGVPDSVEARQERLVHQRCPYRRDGKEHDFAPDKPCSYCGIRTDQRWLGNDIRQLADLQTEVRA